MDNITARRDHDTLGGRIQRSRETLGMATSQLAARLGVKPETMRGWERDRAEPRANKLITLAGILGVSPAWLIGGYGAAPEDEPVPGSDHADRLAALRSRRDGLDREIARLEEQDSAAG
ncbi:MAG: helix-turn-helix transcriptional regulator [Aurantimonas endophytica]|uniref:Transcriptional regulator with XRE-family HTH domain n=1 Tax=Aurantimonas endophytica TaxID=1522175 RepID=A0A7W6MN12_9HYPH|nr:transcriptional regulator with XRE-family HTH domain [Aurantimonas endophytica]